MMFNHRRQSRDRVLNADVIAQCKGARLCISPYSMLLFEGSDADILCDERFLELAGEGDFCFVEDKALAPYADRIEEVTVYKIGRAHV